MSTRGNQEPIIRYLSIDEMMLKIAKMRAEGTRHDDLSIAMEEAPSQEQSAPALLEFPEYISHCEAWCAFEASAPVEEAEPEATRIVSVRRPESPRLQDSSLRSEHSERRSHPATARITHSRETTRTGFAIKSRFERSALTIGTLGIAALMLIGTALHMRTGSSRC